MEMQLGLIKKNWISYDVAKKTTISQDFYRRAFLYRKMLVAIFVWNAASFFDLKNAFNNFV